MDGIELRYRAAARSSAVAGVQGNGQTELTEAILGLQDRVRGSITLDGDELVGRSVKEILDAGVGFVPEDRSVDGLVGDVHHRREPDAGPLRPGAVRQGHQHEPGQGPARSPRRGSSEFDVRTPSARRGCRHALRRQPAEGRRGPGAVPALRLFVAAQPTRGVDVGSIEFIHKRIVAERDRGTPVMVVSTELDEVVALADRITVMYRGRIVGIVPAGTPRDVLGLMMAGVSPDEAQATTPQPRPALGRRRTRQHAAENPAEHPAEDAPATNPAPAAPSVQEPALRRRRRPP